MQPQILTWSEVEECANDSFNLFVLSDEKELAQNLWQVLIDNGSANYSNDLEKCQAQIRFICLADIYHEFCGIAFDEYVEPSFTDWSDTLGLNYFRLGQLIGSDQTLDQFIDLDEECIENAIHLLSDNFRTEVFNTLMKKYGSATELFLIFYKINLSNEEEDYDILNDPTPEQLEAFSWITDRGYPYF